MKKTLLALIMGTTITLTAQAETIANGLTECPTKTDTVSQSKPFKANLRNDEYKIYLRINLHDKNITVPGQDVYGQLDGYIGSSQGSGVWLITSAEIKSRNTAVIEVINDYGSEDFTATLRANNDGTYTLKKNGGSTLKFAVRGKWQKLPSTIDFKKQ